MSTELARPAPADITVGSNGLQLTSLQGMTQFAKVALQSGLVPQSFKSPEAVVIAFQAGFELGLMPLQSLQSIYVVGGKPTLYGKAIPGLVWKSGQCTGIREWWEGEGDNRTAYCEASRKGIEGTYIGSFNVARAKKANLLRSPTWASYTDEMLMAKARARCLGVLFADVLCAMPVKEDLDDIRPITAREVLPNADPLLAKAVPVAQVIPPVDRETVTVKPARLTRDAADRSLIHLYDADGLEFLLRGPDAESLGAELKAAVDMQYEATLTVRMESGRSYIETADVNVPKSEDLTPPDDLS